MYLWNKVTVERLEEIKAEKSGKEDIEVETDRVIDNNSRIIYYV